MGIGEQLELEKTGRIEPEVYRTPPPKGRLYGMRCYLIGAMDRAKDNGVGWRDALIPFLVDLGVVVLNPCDKPIDIGLESIEDRERRLKLKAAQNYDQLSKEIKLLRVVDLRMVDMSDFLIFNIDTAIHACGSYEETSWANRLKRPILVHCEQGKAGIPDWMFGKLPHQMFFTYWSDMKAYLFDVNSPSSNPYHFKRWMFFDYARLTPEGQREYYRKKGYAVH